MATVPEAAQPKPSITQSVTIHFDTMTWGALRRFVALADREHVQDDEDVVLAWNESEYDDCYAAPIGLTFTALDGGL